MEENSCRRSRYIAPLVVVALASLLFVRCPEGGEADKATLRYREAYAAARNSPRLDTTLVMGLSLGMPIVEAMDMMSARMETYEVGYHGGKYQIPFTADGHEYIVNMTMTLGPDMTLGRMMLEFPRNTDRKKLVKRLKKEFSGYGYFRLNHSDHWIRHSKEISLDDWQGELTLTFSDATTPFSFTNTPFAESDNL